MSEPGLTAPRLQADDLACLRGGRLVFVGLSFRLGAGEALVLTGPNGSGKSSLLRLVAGLVPTFAGTLDWTGGSRLDRLSRASGRGKAGADRA